MLDTFIRPYIDPPLNKAAALIAQNFPVSATSITIFGFIIGLLACLCGYAGYYTAALILMLLNRLCDGTDGPLARHTRQSSDFGGYLDIVCDFLFYAAFPFAFALGFATPSAVAAGGFILFSFIASGTSFLAYAVICAKRGMETSAQGQKSFYYSLGLMEGTETILYFVLICLLPQYFITLSVIFGILCFLTALQRMLMARAVFQ